MKSLRLAYSIALALLLALTAPVLAETTVTVKGLHLCCGGCAKIIQKAIGKVDGADVKVDRATKSVTITATDDKTAGKALRALARAGFYGKTDNAKLAIKTRKKIPEGKVERLVVAGVHNCCGQCCKALKKICQGVDGVTGENIKPKGRSFVVEGNFEASALIEALNEAGFYARVGKKKGSK